MTRATLGKSRVRESRTDASGVLGGDGQASLTLQHVASAAAVNLERLAAWFRAVPRAATRTSRFAGLATA